MDEASRIIEAAIDAEPHCRRLYPDLYAAQVAQALRDAGLLRETGDE